MSIRQKFSATSRPSNANSRAGIGLPRGTGQEPAISNTELSQFVSGLNDDPAHALLAEQIRTQTKLNANFITTAFAINPPFAVHPATPVVFTLQVLPANPNRKSFSYQETVNAARQANGVTQSGFILQPGPGTATKGNLNSLAQMIQVSFLSQGGQVGIDSPAPTNPITVAVQYGPPATVGSPVCPLVGTITEAI
jgi:hypothetical protein